MRKALIVIDMQYDFIDGSLGTNEAQNILPNVNDLIDKKDYDNLFLQEILITKIILILRKEKIYL